MKRIKLSSTGMLNARWPGLSAMLTRAGPFSGPDFVKDLESADHLDYIQNEVKILVLGAGGLGCELLKNLVLNGFRQLHVIDMDVIDESNLNRQFLFTHADIGRSKAEVAANFINSQFKDLNIVPYFRRIEDFDANFYRDFNMVICGLDSVAARRWINKMLCSLLRYDDGESEPVGGDDGLVVRPDPATVVPLIDGGTEGFKGNVRVIYPGMSACIECQLDLFPPQVNYPLCTIASIPRLPEHCIEWARLLAWPDEDLNPRWHDVPPDGDNPEHLQWLFETAARRAEHFRIEGVTMRLTLGVIKRIIPAVSSTNAAVAAVMATEALKLVAFQMYGYLSNYMTFANSDGVYSYSYEADRKPDCAVCVQLRLKMSLDAPLADLLELLKTSYGFVGPDIYVDDNGVLSVLFISDHADRYADRLSLSLAANGFRYGKPFEITDKSRADPRTCRLVCPDGAETHGN